MNYRVFISSLVISMTLLILFVFQYQLSLLKYDSLACVPSSEVFKSTYEAEDISSRIRNFLDTATSLDPTTDKVTSHSYQTMYGTLLVPFYRAKPTMKFLEIGLGCNQATGPGASTALWKKLFPKAEIWQAEYDGACVIKSKEKGQLDGVHTLVGDQADFQTLDRWIHETNGANFDVVIDDGGHANCQIYNSFVKLWPLLNPGGLYFIEDLQIGNGPFARSVKCETDDIMGDIITQWNYKLMFNGWRDLSNMTHPVPKKTRFIMCQEHACVIGKE